jgi:hypothetical protein
MYLKSLLESILWTCKSKELNPKNKMLNLRKKERKKKLGWRKSVKQLEKLQRKLSCHQKKN